MSLPQPQQLGTRRQLPRLETPSAPGSVSVLVLTQSHPYLVSPHFLLVVPSSEHPVCVGMDSWKGFCSESAWVKEDTEAKELSLQV